LPRSSQKRKNEEKNRMLYHANVNSKEKYIKEIKIDNNNNTNNTTNNNK